MKKGIVTLALAAAMLGGSLLIMGQERGDQETAAQVVDAIDDVSELVGQSQGEPALGPPELTRQVVEQVLVKLQHPERHGGLLKIARAHGCSLAQVKLIEAERQRRIQELTPGPGPGDLNP